MRNYLPKRCVKRWANDIMAKFLTITFFSGSAWAAIGAPVVPAVPVVPEWVTGWDLPRVLIAGLFAIVGFFLIFTLNKFDRNQNAIFERLRIVEEKHAELKGRCDAIACKEK